MRDPPRHGSFSPACFSGCWDALLWTAHQLVWKQVWALSFSDTPLSTNIPFSCCLASLDLQVSAPALPSLLSPGFLNFLGLDYPLDWRSCFKPGAREMSVPWARVWQCHLSVVRTAGKWRTRSLSSEGCVDIGKK